MLLKMKVVSWSLGIFFAISFILCVLYGLVVPPRLHGMSAFLEAVLPAFKWLTFGGFVLGLVESFLYGVYIGIVFVPVYNFINRRWGYARDEVRRMMHGRKSGTHMHTVFGAWYIVNITACSLSFSGAF